MQADTAAGVSAVWAQSVCREPAALVSLQSPGTRAGSREGRHPAEPHCMLWPRTETPHTPHSSSSHICQQMLLPTIPSFLFALENISLNENWRRQLEIGKVPLGQALQQRTCNNYRFKMSESSPSPQAGMDPFVL